MLYWVLERSIIASSASRYWREEAKGPIPTRCTRLLFSTCHTSSARAHHRASRLSNKVMISHGAADPLAPGSQFANVRQPARIASTATPAAKYLRLGASTRRSTPPVTTSLEYQPAGRLGNSDARVNG